MTLKSLDLLFEINRAHAVCERRFDADLGMVHGVGFSELQLLVALDTAPERRLRRVDLARELGVTPSGVTWMLRPLIKRGLVASETSATDARVAFAILTDAGRRLAADATPSARRLAEELLAGLENSALMQTAEVIAGLGHAARRHP